MPASALASSQRYYRPETTEFTIVSAIADITAPTRIELDAGTDVSGEVADVSGFQVTAETIDTPDYGSKFIGSIGGATTAADSVLTCYLNLDSSTGSDIRDELTRGDNTHLCIYDSGDVEANLMDVYPVQVTAMPKMRGRTDPARIEVQFSVTAEPAEDVAVPA